ncbi:response regulator transcription factor [Pseudoflavitalea sp. G-6-1-2]|uniref:response regulator transcription factor n=1 Tax=Pseudoflavitalea sp. G-6-1-2 TaxID=2728841 RepID=UPI00146E85FA|nr:response regulator transcription factor [Pseudoflavitalea sp. G-6-1-2]NML19882.1 response regulator transcription factor [Pseudoflavitalea sp. G-6-1-2]
MNAIKILYVEDELFLGKIVKESLESRSYHVVMESDGANVLEAFRLLQPDVCVLDVMLPGVDGFTLATAIREIDALIPIIFLTAKTQTNDLVKGFSVGGNDYIRKPFSMEELIVRIENVLKSRRPAKPAPEQSESVNIGKYSFHFVRQTLSSASEERKLSFRESELLRLLYTHKDRIIDRREILNLLWGNDSFFNSRNLDVYITKLRSYLKDDDQLSIITIKGVGYRFAVGG